MQIKYRGGEEFQVRSKDLEIILSGGITINGFSFPGPGEYEKSGVILNGISDGTNTIYTLVVEEITLCYLGKINHDLTEDEAKVVGAVDILFLPLGAQGSANIKTALKILSKIDPKVVIPMLYDDLAEFKKEEAIVDSELSILKIKKSELPEEERQIFVLNPSV